MGDEQNDRVPEQATGPEGESNVQTGAQFGSPPEHAQGLELKAEPRPDPVPETEPESFSEFKVSVTFLRRHKWVFAYALFVITTCGIVPLLVALWTFLAFKPEAGVAVICYFTTCDATKIVVAAGNAPSRREPAVVVLDTADPTKVYDEELGKQLRTNADFIAEQLRHWRIPAQSVKVGLQLQDLPDFTETKPDLVILHRSTFYPSDNRQGQNQLAAVIRAAPKSTRFLIFSRKGETDTVFEREVESESGASGRVFAVELPEGNPWHFQTQTTLLLCEAERILVSLNLSNSTCQNYMPRRSKRDS